MISSVHLKAELSVKKVPIKGFRCLYNLVCLGALVSNEIGTFYFLPTIFENLCPSSEAM